MLPAGFELGDEVVEGGALLAGDQADVQGSVGDGSAAVGVEQPLGFQLEEQLLTFALEAAERELRIDGGHPQLHPTSGPEPLQPAADADLGAIGHPDAAALFELLVHLALGGREEGHAEEIIAGVGGHQVEVHVAARRSLQVLDLPADPELGWEDQRQLVPDDLADLADRVGVGGHRAEAT